MTYTVSTGTLNLTQSNPNWVFLDMVDSGLDLCEYQEHHLPLITLVLQKFCDQACELGSAQD